MCGIVGCIGNEGANELVLEGLRRLEYRGYDSCGVSFLSGDKIKVVKSIDRIKDLTENVSDKSSISFGHTRWATHGGVNLENAHPHITLDRKMGLVHNGVVENYLELKEQYCSDIDFQSETDTEVLLYVLQKFYNDYNDINKAIVEFMNVVHGSYALIMYNTDFPNKLFAIKHKSPMLIGRGEGFYTISSDPSAVVDKVIDFYQLDDYKFIIMDQSDNSAELYGKDGKNEELIFSKIDMEYEEITTKDYDSFMHKEIEEQPKAIRNIVENYKTLGFDAKLIETIKSSSRIYIVACGTSYHAGLVGRKFIENKLNIPTEVLIASEYGYEKNIISDNACFIFISQSGETADSMLVFNQVIGKYPVVAITNVRGSQMDRNADYSLQLFAGVEIAVASTKAYTAQIAVLAALVYSASGDNGIFDKLLYVADCQEKVIADQDTFKVIANKLKNYREVFYLGRLMDYSVAQECALKIKEITYINVNAMASGELKHGTISLIDPDKLVFALISDNDISANSRSNIQEVRARDGEVLIFSTTQTKKDGDDYVVDFDGDSDLAALVTILPHQYLSLFTALAMDLDVDKPRNLAKAVTVE